MSVSEATVDLLFQARNLAGGAVDSLTSDLKGIASTATTTAGKIAGAFRGLGGALANGIGNATETLSSGGTVTEAMAGLGVYMAGQLAEQFAGSLLETLPEKIAGSGVVAVVTAPIAAAGSALGSILSGAIALGMAAFPFILIGVIVGAFIALQVNPDLRKQVIDFASGIVFKIIGAIGDGLRALVGLFTSAFGGAFTAVTTALTGFLTGAVALLLGLPGRIVGLGASILQTIIGGFLGFPGRVAQIIGDAFRNLHLDIGPFHISGAGVSIDLPKIDVPHFAVGTPYVPADMLAVVHQGEAIIPAANNPFTGAGGGGGATVTIQGVSERELGQMIDRQLYFRLQRAGTGI